MRVKPSSDGGILKIRAMVQSCPAFGKICNKTGLTYCKKQGTKFIMNQSYVDNEVYE